MFASAARAGGAGPRRAGGTANARREAGAARRSAHAAEELHNTPAICRKSYVHDTVVTAFEDGVLEQFSEALRGCAFADEPREKVLAQILRRPRLSPV